MGFKKLNNYQKFLSDLDSKLESYFKCQSDYICCKKGCSFCCEKGDYPISEIELLYLMQGYSSLSNDIKLLIQKNISTLEKGEKCPFLINKECSIYQYRPIICRVHGLAYLCHNKTAKIPYCVNNGLNYSKHYDGKEINIEPISENLDTHQLLQDLDYGKIRNLYDWIKKDN